MQAVEEYQRLLASLPKRNLCVLAQWKMEGFTNQEIAVKLTCSVRSVERKLRIIRGFWEADALDERVIGLAAVIRAWRKI